MRKIIVVAGFKGGVGKSTIANFLGEKIGATIINLDMYQDNEDFNSTETINVSTSESLEDKIKSSGIYIVDAGGFDDARLYELPVDLFIFPTRTDYRSIKTTIDSAATILDKSSAPEKRAMIVINQFENDKDLDRAVEILETIVSMSEIDAELSFFGLKKSNAITTAIDKKMGLGELAAQGGIMGHAYKSVNDSFDELAKEVKELIQ